MHEGIDRQGNHLYPAFPYPSYTKVSRDDVRAIKAYLDTVKPVRQRPTPNELPWPMSMRSMMAIWNGLYFDAGTYQSDPKRSAQWNRGAYLVQGLGHCGACHTPRNFAGAADDDRPLQGGHAEHVYAPSLVGDPHDGLGGWSQDDIVQYLGTGSNPESTAAGPMVEVVEQSTQYLSKPDLRAVAVYLKSLRGTGKDNDRKQTRDDATMKHGAQLYVDNCDGCHLRDGSGETDAFPPLRASSAIQAADPDTLIQIVLQGGKAPATEPKPTGHAMPAFSGKLDDADVADVLTYIRNSWGNHASAVPSGAVGKLRKTLHDSP
jgi:mono/diheme cytochrome c family protein